THWSLGAPDGFDSPVFFPGVFALVGVAVTAILGGAVVLAARKSGVTLVLKFLAVTPLWLTAFLGVSFTWILGSQRGIADAADAPSPLPALLVGLAAAFLLAVIGWFVMPPADRAARGASTTVAAVKLTPNDRVLWTTLATASTTLLLIVGGVALLVTGAVAAIVVRSGGHYWWLLFTPILVMLLLISSFAWRVRIDQRGVEVRSVLGAPRFFIPADHIASASVTEVNPIGDFGGWGMRWGLNKRFGVVLHKGAALEVHRTDGHSLVVTIDRPEDAAALVNGLVARAGKPV
ncbi:MAG: hypothetical protein ABJB03_11625, partial [Rhodoglobus sp.]